MSQPGWMGLAYLLGLSCLLDSSVAVFGWTMNALHLGESATSRLGCRSVSKSAVAAGVFQTMTSDVSPGSASSQRRLFKTRGADAVPWGFLPHYAYSSSIRSMVAAIFSGVS
jgi:hypothetical protein